MYLFLAGVAMPLIFAVCDLERRKLLRGRPVIVVSAVCFTYLAVVLFLGAVVMGPIVPSARGWLAIAASVPLNWLGVYCWFHAIGSATPLAVIVSYSALGPVLTLVTSLVILGELPTNLGIAGIFVVAVGVYVQNSFAAGSLMEPVRRVLLEPGPIAALLSGVCVSLTGPIDKIGVSHANLMTYLGIQSGLVALCMHLQGRRQYPEAHRQALREFVSVYWRIGLLWPVGCTLFLLSITKMLVGYVLAFRMLGTIPAALLAWAYLGERPTRYHVAGALLMISGAVAIVLT